ncbi:hypothetical protein FRB95_012930 [Tulasnella sp. JGI-2019a]|nr:hypothetical protein FRB95_012930 [Tulasnella sp. JGI-2019a]
MGRFKFWGARFEGLDWICAENDGRDIICVNWTLVTSSLVMSFVEHSHLRSIRFEGIKFLVRQAMVTGWGSRLLPELEVFVLDNCDAYTIDILSYADMPVLHTLSITCSDASDPNPTVPSRAMSAGIAHIPSVQRLTLIHIPTLQDLTNILSSVPNVKHLTLRGQWRLEPFDDEVEGFVSHLESLQIIGTKIDMPRVKSVVTTRFSTLSTVALGFGRGEGLDVKETEEFKWLQEHVTLTLLSGHSSNDKIYAT